MTEIAMEASADAPAATDVLGIGFGPANIALAIALEELWPEATVQFLEAGAGPTWQPGMLLPRADIQHHPLRDLVTPRNPRSRYTFVNYLHEQGRLFDHLNLKIRFPLRKEYAAYISWAAAAFDDAVEYDQRVVSVTFRPAPSGGERGTYLVRTESGRSYAARALVVATGRPALIPPVFDTAPTWRVFHSARYLSHLSRWAAGGPGTVAVVGASQTAAEICLDLRSRFPDARVVNVMRAFGYRLKDTSPFMEEVYFPEFVDYYYRSSRESKADLRRQLHHTNYSSVDGDLLEQLYTQMYEDRLDGDARMTIKANRDVVDVAEAGDGVALTLRERHTGEVEMLTADLVVLATGFRNLGPGIDDEPCPSILRSLLPFLQLDDRGCVTVEQDYRLAPAPTAPDIPAVHLNGLCESSHGMGDAGSFSLLAIRTAVIVRSLMRRGEGPPVTPASSGPAGRSPIPLPVS